MKSILPVLWSSCARRGAVLALLVGSLAGAQELDDRDRRIEQLETQVRYLTEEIKDLRGDAEETRLERAERLRKIEQAVERYAPGGRDEDHWTERLTLGGYGEMHANFGESKSADLSDIHRFVIEVDYRFNDWIEFVSETEIEHAFVNDGNGEISIEQFFVDFDLDDRFTIRFGRFLTPVGLVNRKHEPTTFNGVERPAFAQGIVPTTWSSDGFGAHGTLFPWLTYQAYVVSSLDGSRFDAVNGIRSGRIKERPSLHEVAATWRFDFYPLTLVDLPATNNLRFGTSFFMGGLDNGNRGRNPDLEDVRMRLYAGDFEYSVGDFDLRGEVAWIDIDNASAIGRNVAEGIFGWYAEAAYHWFPDAWKVGRFASSDAVVFARYDHVDTQHDMPDGSDRVSAGMRREVTAGMTFFFTPNLVLKADVQFPRDRDNKDQDMRFNLGIGFQF